jgi:hypothetical protein
MTMQVNGESNNKYVMYDFDVVKAARPSAFIFCSINNYVLFQT